MTRLLSLLTLTVTLGFVSLAAQAQPYYDRDHHYVRHYMRHYDRHLRHVFIRHDDRR